MGVSIDEDIGQMAGAIWHALNTHGELPLAQLKKLKEGKAPIFDCRAHLYGVASSVRLIFTEPSSRRTKTHCWRSSPPNGCDVLHFIIEQSLPKCVNHVPPPMRDLANR